MFEISKYLITSNLKGNLKRYKSELLYSFIIGLLMGSIPFIYKLQDNFRVNKLIQEQKKIQMMNKEKLCKTENSDYAKFLSLGFPKTAIEKLNICMTEK